jgi:hypothetical protein
MKQPSKPVEQVAQEVTDKYAGMFERLSDHEAPVKVEESSDPRAIALQAFIRKHPERCQAWARDHGNVKFPILYDESAGEWRWVGRKTRRELGRKNAKKSFR